MRTSTTRSGSNNRVIVVVVLVSLLGAACGGGDTTTSVTTTSSTTLATAATPTTTTSVTTTNGDPRSTTTGRTTTTRHITTTTSRTTTTTSRGSIPRPTVAASTTPAAPRPTGGLAGKVIVVDPGHNGANGTHPSIINALVDAGGFQKACNTTGTAAPNGYTEALFNWQTSQLLVAALRAAGATVILTRTSNDGVGPCIDVRGQTADTNNADALISVHADGSSSADHGFHVIYPPVVPGYITASASASERLAVAVRDAEVAAGLAISTYIGSNGLSKRSDLGTLNRTGDRPGVIIECGNMKNVADLASLQSPAGQATIARAITSAFADFFA